MISTTVEIRYGVQTNNPVYWVFYLQQQKLDTEFRQSLWERLTGKIYNSRNQIRSLDLTDKYSAAESTTVEIRYGVQTASCHTVNNNLQQQKLDTEFRLKTVLEQYGESTTVEIRYGVQTWPAAATDVYLQQQKLDTEFRPDGQVQRCRIYNSRNQIRSLDYFSTNQYFFIYNSRNQIRSLDPGRTRCWLRIYNSRNQIRSLDQLNGQWEQTESTTVEIRYGVQTIAWLIKFSDIYNSRNQIRSLDFSMYSDIQKSTTVEIRYGVQTECLVGVKCLIYNSRNQIRSLDPTATEIDRTSTTVEIRYGVQTPLDLNLAFTSTTVEIRYGVQTPRNAAQA